MSGVLNLDLPCNELAGKIDEWKTEKKDTFVETLMLHDIISTKSKHWLPNKEEAIIINF